MDRSLFLARLIGPTFVAIALGMLINLGRYESMIAEALHSGILFYLSGLLSLLAGLAIVNLHNTWCADWRVIVTVLGWLMTIGAPLLPVSCSSDGRSVTSYIDFWPSSRSVHRIKPKSCEANARPKQDFAKPCYHFCPVGASGQIIAAQQASRPALARLS